MVISTDIIGTDKLLSGDDEIFCECNGSFRFFFCDVKHHAIIAHPAQFKKPTQCLSMLLVHDLTRMDSALMLRKKCDAPRSKSSAKAGLAEINLLE